MKAVRLDRLLANLGYGSRRETQGLIRSGAVRFDDAVLDDPRAPIAAVDDLSARLRIAGAPLDPIFPLTLMVHKPSGAVCSHREPGRSVYELLPERWRRRRPTLSTIGRLDGDTTGLLLITDDGALAHKVSSPRGHLAKRYRVELAKPLTGAEHALFASGELLLDGEAKPLAPARLEPLSSTTAHLTLGEGRYHQVKRMFAAIGNEVVRLHRDRIGALDLPADLPPGAYRLLSPSELGALAV